MNDPFHHAPSEEEAELVRRIREGSVGGEHGREHRHHHHRRQVYQHHQHHRQQPQLLHTHRQHTPSTSFRPEGIIMNVNHATLEDDSTGESQPHQPHGPFYTDVNVTRGADSLFSHPSEQQPSPGSLVPATGSPAPDRYSHSPIMSTSSSKPMRIRPSQQQQSPRQQPQIAAPGWPSRDVTDETIDDAYAQFILMCNPSIPADCDTTELRKAFRLPPKSDGNTFNTFRLLELISKLEDVEDKEIKTWTKLAVELGVERKDDQSTQKVQQYAVRLKRWMHAMHVDAFFEYCLNKPHEYYTNIPYSVPMPSDYVRDGVPLEEDLALRALQPESRPKRGRRKTEDKSTDDGFDEDPRASKRPQLELETSSPVLPDQFGHHHHHHHHHYPQHHPGIMQQTSHSALPNGAEHDIDRYLDPVTPDQWSAATAAALSATVNSASGAGSQGGQQFRWRAFPRDGSSQPRSATDFPPPPPPPAMPREENLGPMTPSIPTPMSATATSSKSRTRRKHGPAVSSAWPSAGSAMSGGKLRGRPPTNRSVRDGPFSTFPANPQGKQGPAIDLTSLHYSSATPTHTPITNIPHHFSFAPTRPTTLHLQVPGRLSLSGSSAIDAQQQHMASTGLSERPGERNMSFDKASTLQSRIEAHQFIMSSGTVSPSQHVTVESIEHQFAARLLFSSGDDPNMTSDKARAIASSIIAGLRKSRNLAEDESLLARNAAVLLGCDGMHITHMYVSKIGDSFGNDEDAVGHAAHLTASETPSHHHGQAGDDHDLVPRDVDNDIAKDSTQSQPQGESASRRSTLGALLIDQDDLLDPNPQTVPDPTRHTDEDRESPDVRVEAQGSVHQDGGDDGLGGVGAGKSPGAAVLHDVEDNLGLPSLEEYHLEWTLSLGLITVTCSSSVTINSNLDTTSTLSLQDEVEKLFSGMAGTEALTAGPAPESSHITIEGEDDEDGTAGAGAGPSAGDGAPNPGNSGADSDMDWKEKYFQSQEHLKRARIEMERLKRGILETVMSVDQSR